MIDWRPIAELDKCDELNVYLFCTDEGLVHCGTVYNQCTVCAPFDWYRVNLDEITHFADINLPAEYA